MNKEKFFKIIESEVWTFIILISEANLSFKEIAQIYIPAYNVWERFYTSLTLLYIIELFNLCQSGKWKSSAVVFKFIL